MTASTKHHHKGNQQTLFITVIPKKTPQVLQFKNFSYMTKLSKKPTVDSSILHR